MQDNEKSGGDVAAQKSKIRSRYRGIDPSLLEVILAKPVPGLYDDDVYRRVAVYARVSTGDPRQTSSYELQKNYYEDYVGRHPNWELVKIYADEGISGTSLRHRDAFNEMIVDCKAGKIDMIITKSVSRFARNIMDCIGTVNELKLRTPAIGVLFENEQIYTLNAQSEMSLSFIAAMEQEESHTKSTSMNASYEMRFSHGIFLTPPLLGFDQDENGKLVINEDEAKTVRLIFFTYLYGYSTQQIADLLMKLERPTKKGNLTWSSSTVLGILQNERHCGAVLAHKTYTPNYLDHRSRKNRGERNQYRRKDDHEAIISPEDFVAVQRKISNARYGGYGIPELRVISEGTLTGFVVINPRWASFCTEDYFQESAKAADCGALEPEEISMEANQGDPDLRGFEAARSQFFSSARQICVTIGSREMKFGIEALRKLGEPSHVELLIHPQKKLLAVRASDKDNRIAVKWSTGVSGKNSPKTIPGAAFLPTIFSVLGWNAEYRYRVSGIRRQRGTETVLLFDLSETEVLIPTEMLDAFRQEHDTEELGFSPLRLPGHVKTIVAYPQSWAEKFGQDYYMQTQGHETAAFAPDTRWNVDAPGDAYYGSEPQGSSREHIKANIQQILTEFQEVTQ